MPAATAPPRRRRRVRRRGGVMSASPLVPTPCMGTAGHLGTPLVPTPCVGTAGHFFGASYLIHDTCVTRWSRAANEIAALVANLGLLLAGKVDSVASPTRKTLKSLDRFW